MCAYVYSFIPIKKNIYHHPLLYFFSWYQSFKWAHTNKHNHILTMTSLSLIVENFITLKPNQTKYPLWREQALALAESQELVEHLTNEDPAPIKYTTQDPINNLNTKNIVPVLIEAFITWRKSDRLLRGWIIGTLSKEALSLVIGLKKHLLFGKCLKMLMPKTHKSVSLHFANRLLIFVNIKINL